ncbi:MAG: hypothetical protein IT160_16545 [Bryobacterales bacterium]|nr:hypothetical protein [Bryobacterales bacterium]
MLILAAVAVLSADRLTMRDGRAIDGTYLGGNSREVRMAVGDRVQSFDIGSVRTIEFGAVAPAASQAATEAPAAASSSTLPATAPAAAAAAAPAAPSGEPQLVRRTEAAAQPSGGAAVTSSAPPAAPSAPASTGTTEVPAGTNFVVRLIDSVDSERDSVGQSYRATVDEPVVVGGNTVVPRGADAVVKLVDDQESGKLAGRTILTLDLMSVTVNGKPVEIDTQEATVQSGSRTGRTGKVVGGTAALGAIIGAIAGGGKGAAIGAVSGAGVGAAAQVITKGQTVKIPSESRLTFSLRQNIRI